MGGKKGGGGHTPYEAPDSLKSAQRLRAMGLISLGPIRGAVTPDKYESAFFDNTPLKNAQGEWNYQNTEINYNLGTQDQLPLEGFEMSEREVPVSAEVKFDHPLSRRVIDPDITRLRITLGVNALFEQNDQGDTYGTKVDLQVLINGQHKEAITIDGKSSSRFHRSYILDNLPPVPFTITVKRLTADSKSQRLQNGTFWSSYTEIIDTKLSYPNMAMVGIKTDSRYNPNFPNINFLLYGRLVKVPSNYDPDTRTYAAGLWKGDFKLAWTNNPAWVFYDLVTNKLAGLGQRLGDYGVDKFQLYQIAQYCDQLVPDGYGGFEPRMVANLWITDQRDAYSVISDMASVFRAIAVWNGVQYTAIQDRPSDPVCTYTQANVIDGKFNRQYAPLKSIFTAVEVEFADENNFYQKAIEYVADDSMIERYGYNVKKIVAFACTSRGQARRYGKWVLETSRLEQCTINFSVGRDGLQIIPGDIIEVADKSYANLNLGGRVIAVSDRQVTLDAPIETEGESYLSYLGEDKRLVRHKISQIDRQNKALVTLDTEPVGLHPMDLWTLHTPLVSTQRYRVLTIAENDNGSYIITALQHVPQKEAIVDDGASFEPLATTTHRGLLPVTNPEISTDGSGVILNFSAPFFVGQGLTYQVRLFRNGKFYQIYDDLKEPNLAFNDLPNGDYVAEIRAKNGQGQLSEAVSKTFNINFAVSELVTVSKVFGIGLAWKNPLFAPTNSAIEIWVSKENRFETARKLVSLAYPTNSYTYDGLGIAETYYFWARMVDNVNGTAGEFTPVTEGISERSAEKLVDYLEGQITRSTLGEALINSLIEEIGDNIDTSGLSDRLAQLSNQLRSEAQARASAIQAEARARTEALQAEARQRGNAISQVETINAQQSEQIRTMTAKAEGALSGLQEERIARVEGDKVEAEARKTLTSRVDNTESGLTHLQRTVTQQGQSLSEKATRLEARLGQSESSIQQLHSSKASKTEVASIARTALRSEWQSDAQALAESAKNQAITATDAKISTLASTVATNQEAMVASVNQLKASLGQASGANLLPNANFKKLSNNFPVGWGLYNNSGGSQPTSYSIVPGVDESNAVKLKWSGVNGTTKGLYIFHSNPSTFEVDQYYVLAVCARVPEGQPQDGRIALYYSNAPGWVDLRMISQPTLSHQWQWTVMVARKPPHTNGAYNQWFITVENYTGQAVELCLPYVSKGETWLGYKAGDLSAEINDERQARVTAIDALTQRADTLTTKIGQAESELSRVAQSLSTQRQSTASEISTLRATVNGIDARADGLVKTEIDLTNLDQNTWYPVIFSGLKPGETTRFRVSQELKYRLHNPTWSSHDSRSFALLCEWSSNGDGWGAINVARVIHNFEYGWVSDHKSPILTIDQMTQSSTEYCRLRGGAKYDVFAPSNITVEKKPGGYSIHQQIISAQPNYSPQLVPQSMLKKLDASITESKQVTADINGKVQAIHSLRTETIAGGRKAVAGITLGSNGGTQSEIILMADKLQLVRNAQDDSPVPMMGVINHNGRTRMALSGDIAVQGDLVGNRFIGGEIDIAGNDGVLRVGRTGRFEMRASQHNRGLVMNNDQILVYDQNGRIRLKIGKL